MYNNIDIPLFIEIEENGLENISEMLKRSNIYINNALIITDKGKSAEFALIVKEELSISDSMIYYVEDNTYEQVKAVEDFARKSKADVLIGVGGGLALDISKLASFKYGSHFISIPTLPSHDGISSPVASIKIDGKRKSMPAAMPMGIVVDINVIRNAPKRFIHSGIMDLLSNLSAIQDWELAFNKGYEIQFNGFANAIAYSAADNILNYPYDDIFAPEFLHICINSLVLSGIAMEITGSSRPASGAEHNFSHAFDELYPDNTYFHGEKVGLGTLLVSYIRDNGDFEKMMKCYKRFELISALKELNIEREKIVSAFVGSVDFRTRYTILKEKEITPHLTETILDKIF